MADRISKAVQRKHKKFISAKIRKLLREGKKKTFRVEIGKRKDAKDMAQQESAPSEGLGFHLETLTPDLAGRLGLEKSEKGVIITGVEEGSKAYEANLRRGDLIKEINRNPVNGVDDFRKAIANISKGDPVQFLIKRIEWYKTSDYKLDNLFQSSLGTEF